MGSTALTLLGLASNLLHGAAMMERLEYEAAAAVLSDVVAASNRAPQMAELARLLRAEASRRADQSDAAREDLDWLVRHATDETIRTDAFDRLQRLSGGHVAGSTGPPRNLAWTWRRFVHEISQAQWSAARQRVTGFLGDLADCLEHAAPNESQSGAGLVLLARPWFNARVHEVTSTAVRGEILLNSPSGEVRIGARRTADGWMFDRLLSYRPPAASNNEAAPPAAAAANARLSIVVEEVPDPAHVHRAGDDRLHAPRGIPNPAATPITTSAPTADVELSVDDRQRFEQWIFELAADDPVVRARARAALRTAGAAARLVLQSHHNHSDIEVATSVRELLREIR